MDSHLDELPNTDSSSWEVYCPADSTVSFSEVSDDDVEEFFDDTYSDIEHNDHNELEQSSRSENLENAITHSIDCQKVEMLMKRVSSLKDTIIDLRESISEEHRLWKRECEEYNLIHERLKFRALEEVTTAARLASEAYVIESAKGNSSHTPRRNILDNDYYTKLNQIERLCNEELRNVYNDVEALQPLKEIVSQWNISDEKTIDECEEGSN
ncbi:uncharacterized protein [Fopius arisanus]|uniref:MnmG_0 protein n=1 Tax=Fopius arisanus TaxID=64838 RepID=A0A0C9PZ73_9HYME|nr:PREDICTED: uncharacterized protein LOC105271946 [Fopius arisanus]